MKNSNLKQGQTKLWIRTDPLTDKTMDQPLTDRGTDRQKSGRLQEVPPLNTKKNNIYLFVNVDGGAGVISCAV